MQSLSGPKRLNFIVADGIGVPVVGLAIIALSCGPPRDEESTQLPQRALLGAWLLFCVLGAAGASLGISLYAWRFWLLLVPIASTAAAAGILRLLRGLDGSYGLTLAAIVAVVFSVAQLALVLITDTAAGP